MNAFDVLSTTRAMRRLAPDPVPGDLLHRLVEAASWAPSASNGQGVQYLVVTDRDQMAELEPLWQQAVDWYLGGIGAMVPPSMTPQAHARMCAAIRYQRDHFTKIPALIAVCHPAGPRFGPLARFKMTAGLPLRARLKVARTPWLNGQEINTASVYPAVQNLLLAARALGLGATLTLWHALLEDDFKRVLNIPAHVRLYALIPVGRPLGRFGPVRRQPPTLYTDRWE